MQSTSYKKAFEFAQFASNYVVNTENRETKIVEALQSVIEQIDEHRERYQKKLVKIQRKHAAEDKLGCILRDDHGNYRYRKDDEELMEEKIEELFNQEDSVEFEPDYVDTRSIPAHLPALLRKKFIGFVIQPHSTPAQNLINSLPTNQTNQSNG
ncbi:hypothetical protein [Dyadobacter chenhuakuii]|uniref:Uncharacterized protein n=1 Tax=Dyadobacter chenhuakuii TaxID=2909339 RepID=A0A9X1QAQ9_9BACT|nr:hypothetical protein [Dyadobacter chenhuakuii]MCF2498388.1 hypothetical protein [Dyadobacter chenhuakuii]